MCREESEFESESDGRGHLARDIGREVVSRELPNPRNVLGLFQWGVAYDRFVLACVGADVWSYATALVYKENCLTVAARSGDWVPARR